MLIRGQKESPGGALQAEIGSKYYQIACHILCQVETGLDVAKKINLLHLVTDFCANRPPELKAEIKGFADEQSLSINEAVRVLSRRGLNASGQASPASTLVEELGYRVRDLEHQLAQQKAGNA